MRVEAPRLSARFLRLEAYGICRRPEVDMYIRANDDPTKPRHQGRIPLRLPWESQLGLSPVFTNVRKPVQDPRQSGGRHLVVESLLWYTAICTS